MTLSRRTILRGAPAALAAGFSLSGTPPAVAQSASKTLRFVPHSNLAAIDPFATSGYVVRNHGYMVYDTLYAIGSDYRPRPQMAEGHETSPDGRTTTIRLRDGLRFHDGEPVRAADCVASLKRWAARDGFGGSIMALADELVAVDDRSLRFRLKQPYPLLIDAIGKASSPVPFIMPERVALTDPFTPIRDATGSGPFRFLAGEWVPGSKVAYERFAGYVPRPEAVDSLSGGKVVHLDRVEWIIMPDPATASAALLRGEVDWYEQPLGDLVPMLQKNRDVVLTTTDPLGSVVLLRFNHLQPPFDNPKVRQAVLAAIDQTEYMTAMVGNPALFNACKAFFPCGAPMSSGAGSEVMVANLDRAKALLKESGYAGEKVVILSPADIAYLVPLAAVTDDLLRRMGMNVELVSTDWGSVLTRRASTESADKGGWSIFHTTAVGVEFMSPASHLALRGNGRAAWPGWPTDPVMETLRQDWIDADDLEAEKLIAAKMERRAFETVPYAPLGQYQSPTALRRDITGLVTAPAPVMWNLRRG